MRMSGVAGAQPPQVNRHNGTIVALGDLIVAPGYMPASIQSLAPCQSKNFMPLRPNNMATRCMYWQTDPLITYMQVRYIKIKYTEKVFVSKTVILSCFCI